MAAKIAAILTAPGSIFFMGGSQKASRDAAKKYISETARNFESDLFFHCSMFEGWYGAGAVQDGRCIHCNKPQQVGCRTCRVSYATQHGLNNKVLDIVRK